MLRPSVLQFEISSNCNINCLGCIRTDLETYDIKGNPHIVKNKFLTIETFKNIIYSPACTELKEVQFCGSIDDPLMHPNFLDMVNILKEQKIYTLIHTNASLRTPKYFEELANKLFGKLLFSIDGLEDTNHLYRRGANWNKIMENARAFINADGNAQWQYIEFPWNKHQTAEAKQLADDMGFKSFKYRRDRSGSPTPGFYQDNIDYHRNQKNKSWKEYVDMIERHSEGKEIECFSQGEKMYFIGHDSRVWPCCFLHNGTWQNIGNHKEYNLRYSKNYDIGWNSLLFHSFEEILNHKFYNEDLTDSWNSNVHGTGCKDRIIRCTQTCSKLLKDQRPIGNFKVDKLN